MTDFADDDMSVQARLARLEAVVADLVARVDAVTQATPPAAADSEEPA